MALSRFALIAALALMGCQTVPTDAVKIQCLPLTDDAALAAASADEIDAAKKAGVPMPNTLDLLGRYHAMRKSDEACGAIPK